MKVEFLTSRWEPAYETFLKERENTLFYYSNGFRKFLKRLLSVEDYYLIAVEAGRILGALPSVLCRGKIGTCLNSLAFFGSNGGVIEFNGNREVSQSLVNEFFELGKNKNCLSATMISSPLAKDQGLNMDYDYLDKRIGHISDIRIFSEKRPENAIDHFGSFTRRMIRKAIKNFVEVEIKNEKNAFDFLKEAHYKHMDEINGKKKPESFFHLVMDHFRRGQDYNLWMAYKDSRPVAGLLLFYFNRTVEYYIPAIVKEYRSIQPLSLLIYEAMKDAARRGYFYWNWGGTHLDQHGVYRFKRQWNAVNIPYYYYIKVYDDHLFSCSEEVIKKEFPYCYLLPFNKLST
ncbi:MAG: GNAT family N-acetyltransferase [Bacteroidota bacterium]